MIITNSFKGLKVVTAQDFQPQPHLKLFLACFQGESFSGMHLALTPYCQWLYALIEEMLMMILFLTRLVAQVIILH